MPYDIMLRITHTNLWGMFIVQFHLGSGQHYKPLYLACDTCGHYLDTKEEYWSAVLSQELGTWFLFTFTLFRYVNARYYLYLTKTEADKWLPQRQDFPNSINELHKLLGDNNITTTNESCLLKYFLTVSCTQSQTDETGTWMIPPFSYLVGGWIAVLREKYEISK